MSSRYKGYFEKLIPAIKEELESMLIERRTRGKIVLTDIDEEIDHRISGINQSYVIEKGFVLKRKGNSLLREMARQLVPEIKQIEKLGKEDIKFTIVNESEMKIEFIRIY